ncbi:hypothetical protein Pan241w_45860 [Gimesia alba]|uniref:Uncharacterized protein n=1 Tax=Gimesia alba TaxID=2527973 RepID=A0A517RKS9_9PLAN|nr:hypothetical protein Pan241w_45860 [Gimesia alba]
MMKMAPTRLLLRQKIESTMPKQFLASQPKPFR